MNPGMSKSRLVDGFTYIELLVVVFVIALVSTLVVVNIERDAGKIAFLEAKRFHALVDHISDESILQGAQMGIRFDLAGNSYNFMIRGEDWNTINSDEILRKREIPADVRISVISALVPESEYGDSEEDQDGDAVVKKYPDIVVEPQGLTSEFEVRFTGGSQSWTVLNTQNEELALFEGDNVQ